MLSLDYIQPTFEGQHLAIVRFEVKKPRRCDLALVRVAPEEVAAFPDWYTLLPSSVEDLACTPHRYNLHIDIDDRNPRAWARRGYEVLDHRKNVPLTFRDARSMLRFHDATKALLEHPLWLAAAEAKLLHGGLALPPSAATMTRTRL